MTNSIVAIFVKQFRDVTKNSDVLMQFIIYPVMAFLMTALIDINVPGMSPSMFVTMFAGMFAGMAFISAVAVAIAEDIENNSLRFLLMAGVKSHEYLMGIGGVFFVIGAVGSVAFAVIMPEAESLHRVLLFFSMVLGVVASILIGAIIGMTSKNQQEALSYGSLSGILISFGPFIANMSGNRTLQNIFRIFYSMNFIDETVDAVGSVENFAIITMNILVLALVFIYVYSKNDSTNKGGAAVNKKAVTAILMIAIVGFVGFRAFMWHNAGFIATDNATVATTMIPVNASGAGVLERFSLQEGQLVNAGDLLGWVEGQEAMTAPVTGLVMQTNAVQGQRVLPMETVAVISDMSAIHIRANIQETDILRVFPGQGVYVRVDTFGQQQFSGYVASIGTSTLTETSLFGGNTRNTLLIPVEINLLDDVDLSRLIGVNASVRIPLR